MAYTQSMEKDEHVLAEITELTKNYRPSAETATMVANTPIVLLVGVTGAGKDTVKRFLLETGEYHHIISHTTRPPRENGGVMEQDGKDYHFIDLEASKRMLEAGEYVEAKMVHGTVYGTSVAEVKAAADTGKIAITDVDVQGVAEYKAISGNVIAVFLMPPNYTEWQRRLHARYGSRGVDPKDMRVRMESAIKELEVALSADYYHFVVNEHVDLTAAIVDKIAHNRDEFNAIDTAVRNIARDLALDLREKIYESDVTASNETEN